MATALDMMLEPEAPAQKSEPLKYKPISPKILKAESLKLRDQWQALLKLVQKDGPTEQTVKVQAAAMLLDCAAGKLEALQKPEWQKQAAGPKPNGSKPKSKSKRRK